MTQDPKTVFEFDPLPGESVPVAGTMTPGEPKKRGRKPKEPKAAKPERKKRGPRRVQTAAEPLAPVAEAIAAQPVKTRKPRQPKTELPIEYTFIRQLMAFTEPTRQRVLAALKTVFG